MSALVAAEALEGAVIKLPSAVDIMIDEARSEGFKITPATAGYLLWEYTGWPTFWERDRNVTEEECIREAARKFFKSSTWMNRTVSADSPVADTMGGWARPSET